MRHPHRIRVALGLAIAMVAGDMRLAAQQVIAPYESRETPGWTFVPTLGFGGLFEDNVAIVGRGRDARSDFMLTVTPASELEFVGRRSRFELGYRGTMRMYRELSALDSYDQRARLSVSRRVSRRLSVFARNAFALVPSTDELELSGIPFKRTGARSNDFTGGFDMALTPRTGLETSYSHQWVDFDRGDDLSGLLQGGYAHGVNARLLHRVTSRLSAGAEYDLRHAIVDRTTRQFPSLRRNSPIVIETRDFTVQNGGAALSLAVAPSVTLSGAAGVSHLDANLQGDARTGPYWRVSLTRDGTRATMHVGYLRRFVPSFGFGGSTQSEEITATLHMPLARNRVYWQGGFAYRDTDPLVDEELRLQSLWVQSIVGYAVSRWMRLEVFAARSYQDTRVAGGKIDRNRFGFQVVTAAPVRIR